MFCFVKRAQLSIRIEGVLSCSPHPGPCTLHRAAGGESIPGLKVGEYVHLGKKIVANIGWEDIKIGDNDKLRVLKYRKV